MLRRQHEGEFHAYPEHHHGVSGVLRRLLWRLGFDPLTVYERLAQVNVERHYWKRKYENCPEEPAPEIPDPNAEPTEWRDAIRNWAAWHERRTKAPS